MFNTQQFKVVSVAATFAGVILMMANYAMFFGELREWLGLVGTLLMMFLAPMAAALVQKAIGQTRAFDADKAGAEICGHPLWLASVL